MKKNIVYVLIAILIILNLKTILDIGNINREMEMVNNSIQGVNSSIVSIQSNVSSTIQGMVEEKKWLYNVGHNITNLSFEKNMKLERISYKSNVQYDSAAGSYEEIEVIIEDYMGKTYIKKSNSM